MANNLTPNTDLSCDAEVHEVLAHAAQATTTDSKLRKNTTSFKITNILPSR